MSEIRFGFSSTKANRGRQLGRVIALCLLSAVAGCQGEPSASYTPPSREASLATTAARTCSGHWESSTIRLNGAIISTRECAE